MKQLCHVHWLQCFFLFWLGSVIVYWNRWSWESASTALHLLVTLLLLIHLALYWVGIAVEMKKSMQWCCLFVQVGLILALTQITHLVILILALSPLLLIIATVTLKRVLPMLLFMGSYCVCILFFVPMIGLTRDWSDIWGGGYAPGVGFLGLFFLVVLLLYIQQTQQAHGRTLALLHELDAAHAQLSAYALRVEELTVITERQRIARDLHDTLIQGVTGLLLQLGVVQTQLRQQKVERVQELLEHVIEQTNDVLADARCAIGDLRTGHIRPDDLVEVVQEEIERMTTTTGVTYHADIEVLSTVPISYCEHVLRAVSEGIANVTRHAHASTVWIQATADERLFTIEVRDDGVGFDPKEINVGIGHYGLLGMRERTKLIGGQLELISTPGEGTILRLCIPRLQERRRDVSTHSRCHRR